MINDGSIIDDDIESDDIIDRVILMVTAILLAMTLVINIEIMILLKQCIDIHVIRNNDDNEKEVTTDIIIEMASVVSLT